MSRLLVGAICCLLALVVACPLWAEAVEGPAWQIPVRQVTEAKAITDLTEGCKWSVTGWPGDKAYVSPGKDGVQELHLEANVDTGGASACYMDGALSSARDWSGCDGLRFNIAAKSSDPGAMLTLRIIVNEETQLKIPIPPLKDGLSRQVVLAFPRDKMDVLKNVSLVRFFLVSKEYANGTKVAFTLSNFELVKLQEKPLPQEQAGIELIIGDGSKVEIIPDSSAMPKATAVVYTGSGCTLEPKDTLTCTATDLFSGMQIVSNQRLGKDIGPNERVEIPVKLSYGNAGYYWVRCDLTRRGKSLVGDRVGFADYYQQDMDEKMIYTLLSLRTGMGLYIIDPAGGYGSGSIRLMHTYDPRDTANYLDFIRAYQHWSGKTGASTAKDTEVMEAGVTATIFAAYAFRQAGDTSRARFAEKLIKNNCDFMIDYMQRPNGSTKWTVNEYLFRNLGEYVDQTTDVRVPDTNQIGEWLRTISRAIIYFKDVPGEQAYVDKLYKAALKSADYLVAVSTEHVGDHKNVIRHFRLIDDKYPGGRRQLFEQEGRQCDVYLPRAMAGLSYFAYVRQLREGSVPQSYLDALRDTTQWCMEKMKPDTGWFDWQCGYEVEGGCHSFLGNMYLAEATQGYYLLAAARKDVPAAKLAAECTKRALHFVTDYCRGFVKSQGPFEFWVGPYLYWQFSEYLGSIGPDPEFSDYLERIHNGWAKRDYKDFTQRTGDSQLFRANELSNIHQSILAYPALRFMEEEKKPFKYPVPTLAELEKK